MEEELVFQLAELDQEEQITGNGKSEGVVPWC
jgi:hypothetical protein